MTKNEVMQQALECIERLNMRGWILADFEDEVYATLDSLKAALEQPVQEPIGDEWTPCMKLPVVVHVRQQRPGESHVSTREGITPVKPDDLIMRGVSGEEYPIGRAIFEQTYSLDIAPPLPPLPVQPEPVKLRRGDILRCIETDNLCSVWSTSTTGQTLVKWSANDFGTYTAEQIGELFWIEPREAEPVPWVALTAWLEQGE